MILFVLFLKRITTAASFVVVVVIIAATLIGQTNIIKCIVLSLRSLGLFIMQHGTMLTSTSQQDGG